MNKFLGLAARVMLAQVFLGVVLIRLSAIFSDPAGYENYQLLLAHFGLPGIFAPLIIFIQLVGGVALLVGFKTKFVAYVLAIFAIFLAVVLGTVQPEVFMLYIAIAGGLLTLAINPQTAFSVDNLGK
ncbi:MAG TPA: DoxX family protein [Methylophilaceae bacterium]|nr:DoxX family protein [Methylophilaceae bacterium]